jgi:hypothetical protein
MDRLGGAASDRSARRRVRRGLAHLIEGGAVPDAVRFDRGFESDASLRYGTVPIVGRPGLADTVDYAPRRQSRPIVFRDYTPEALVRHPPGHLALSIRIWHTQVAGMLRTIPGTNPRASVKIYDRVSNGRLGDCQD